MRELIKKISLRARLAFIILCIENALRKDNSLVKWNKILEIFWSQTSMQFVDEWLYEISKVMPESILEDEYEDNETISFNEYSEFKILYRNTQKFIFQLMEIAFECGTLDLYGAIENDPALRSVPMKSCRANVPPLSEVFLMKSCANVSDFAQFFLPPLSEVFLMKSCANVSDFAQFFLRHRNCKRHKSLPTFYEIFFEYNKTNRVYL